MKTKTIFLAAALAGGMCVAAHAGEGGSVERGKSLFNDPNFAGGSRACDSCHPEGSGLEQAGAKSSFTIMGGSQSSLTEAVNTCIVNANKGEAIEPDSQEMQDITAYIKSLGQ